MNCSNSRKGSSSLTRPEDIHPITEGLYRERRTYLADHVFAGVPAPVRSSYGGRLESVHAQHALLQAPDLLIIPEPERPRRRRLADLHVRKPLTLSVTNPTDLR